MFKKFLFGIAATVLHTPTGLCAGSETVQSLYLDIPTALLEFHEADGKITTAEKMKLRIKLTDLKNGYLEVDPKDMEGLESTIQVALFKLGKTRKVIAVAYQLGDSSDDLRFFEKKTGIWTDITAVVFPIPDANLVNSRTRERVPEAVKKNLNLDDCASGTFRWVLPRKGRKIIAKTASDCLTSGNDKTIFEYEPNGDRFVLLP